MTRKRKKEYPTAKCRECNENFSQKREWQLFCSSYCRYTHFTKKRQRMIKAYNRHMAGEEVS
jgi:hypothetical protein